MAVKFKAVLWHTGELLPAVGIAGMVLTMTAVVPALLVQLFTVAVILYVPVAAGVAPGMEVFCVVALNPLGPVQLYVAPPTAVAFRLSVDPSQMALLLEAVGAAGVGFTVTLIVAGLAAHPSLAITV